MYTRYFNWNEPPFTDAMYELVLLHPRHFLPKKGNALTVFTEHGDDLSGKMYFVSPDGALREGPDNDTPRLPAFPSDRARAPEYVLNPFLVAINADIAFRRHRRVPNPYPLCAEYIELMDLTIDLVDKIYFQPVLDDIAAQRDRENQLRSTDADGDIDMEGNVDEFGVRGTKNKDKTITPKGFREQNRLGKVVQPPGPGAPREETIEYYQYLMSGCDYDDEDDEDEAEAEAEGGCDLAKLGIPTHSGKPDIRTELASPISVLDKVQQWQVQVK